MKMGAGPETGWLLLFSFFWITESAQFLDLPTVSFGEEADLKKKTTGLEHVFTDVWVLFFFGCACGHWAGNMGGTENPLPCLLLPFIVLIFEGVLVLMGENELILLKAAASRLTGPTEELFWTADPLVVEEDTLKLLGTTSWLFFTGRGLFGGVGSAEITLSERDTNP